MFINSGSTHGPWEDLQFLCRRFFFPCFQGRDLPRLLFVLFIQLYIVSLSLYTLPLFIHHFLLSLSFSRFSTNKPLVKGGLIIPFRSVFVLVNSFLYSSVPSVPIDPLRKSRLLYRSRFREPSFTQVSQTLCRSSGGYTDLSLTSPYCLPWFWSLHSPTCPWLTFLFTKMRLTLSFENLSKLVRIIPDEI